MDKLKIFGSAIALLYILFSIYLFSGESLVAYNIGLFLCPVIALMYFLYVRRKTIAFSLFLFFYSLSQILALFSLYMPSKVDYVIGNSLYILAYTSLLIEICRTVCVLNVLKEYKLHVVILLAANIYIIYLLQSIVLDPIVMYSLEYFIELIYNIIILLLLSISLLNYFYKDSRKSFFMFLGSLCIVFSEVLGVAYLYMGHQLMLNFISTTLYFIAFIFLFKQSKIKPRKLRRLINQEI